jgi:PIN domain nuclease of toxin-antitoxin system
MKLLLDTHALIWAVMAPDRLGASATQAIIAEGTEVFASHVSLWELAIKRRLGRLDELGESAGDWFGAITMQSGFMQLPISAKHLAEVEFLPPLHGDPFDRLLVAQARIDGLTLVSVDRQVTQYDVESVWNS